MTGYHDPTNPMQQPLQPVKKGWFARSWWWFLPLIIGGPILLCCGSCGGLMWFGMSELQKMPPYVDGIAACEGSKEVEALIGSPVEVAGFWDTMSNQGNIEANSGTSGSSFIARMPVEGSTGSGWLYIEADSSNGTSWSYQVLEFEDDATGTVVNLLSSPGITPDPSVVVPESVEEATDGLE